MKKLFASLIALCSFVFVSNAQNGYKPGDEVQDFTLKNVDGKMVSLSGMPNAYGYIVIFTCNHCPYAKAYEDRIIALHNRFAPSGLPVVAINSNDAKAAPDDSYANMKTRAKQKNFPFVYLYDETQEIAKRFGAVRTPHVFLVQKVKGGKMKVAYIGAIDDNWENAKAVNKHYLENAISQIEEGIAVEEAETKAIGCTIKWKK